MKLRRALLPYHRWIGLTLGLIALLSAATGAGMAFRKQLDPILYPALTKPTACVGTASLDRVIERARSLHASGRIDYVRIQPARRAPIAVRFLNKDTLYFDRCTGAPVGEQNRYRGLFGTLEWLHRGIWIYGGNIVMGLGALALIAMLVGIGLFLWWPRSPRRFSQGFALNRKLKGPAFNLGLHRTIGAWIAVPLLVSACTGLPNAFEGLKAAMMSIGFDAPARPTEVPAVGAEHPPLSLDALRQKIDRLTPDPREVLIHLPLTAGSTIECYVIEAGAPHANARSYVYADQYSGAILQYVPYRSSSIGSKLYFWMLSVHTGEIGGLAGQLFLFAGAIGMLGLGYTGISSYLRRRIRQARARRTAKAALAPLR